MSDEDKIKPSFEPENTSTLPATDKGNEYEKAIPDMKELIRKNKEEVQKQNLDISSPNSNDVRK
jgi:hypothetical protein